MAHPGGRPTKYDETWIPRLEEAMMKGYTVEMFCHETRLAWSTFYEWVKKYPEFSQAYNEGRKYSEGYHQFYIMKNFENKNLQVPAVKLFMQNCFGWADKKDVQQDTTHSVGEPTQRKVRKVLDGE